ncbi:MAG: hypothetical protein L0Y58_07740 [Verrucomicrobia subdivision 3 bacterium]|nr:hypothetical protein [Limisphaerales bacterium]
MTLGKSVGLGVAGFATASLVVFGFWAVAGRAMYRAFGEAGFYSVCVVLFIGLGTLLLRSLARQLSFARFATLFTGAFVAYAVSWCAAWFLVRGRAGEWVGSLAGAVAFALVIGLALRAGRWIPLMATVLFLTHSVGYFAGSLAYDLLKGASGLAAKLAWGLCYGIGMGAGIGFVFHKCQDPSEVKQAEPPRRRRST